MFDLLMVFIPNDERYYGLGIALALGLMPGVQSFGRYLKMACTTCVLIFFKWKLPFLFFFWRIKV